MNDCVKTVRLDFKKTSLLENIEAQWEYWLDHFQINTSISGFLNTGVGENNSANTCLALSLNIGLPAVFAIAYQAYILAGKDHPCWHQQARSVEREEDICAALTRPAFVGLLSSHILLCRKDGWGVEIYSWLSGVMFRSLSRFMFRTQRRPVGVRDLLWRRHTELML